MRRYLTISGHDDTTANATAAPIATAIHLPMYFLPRTSCPPSGGLCRRTSSGPP